MNLALFDFDGTITFKDSFKPFLYYAAGRGRRAVGNVVLIPLVIAYKLGIVSASRTRATVAGFAFRGRPLIDMQRLGAGYAREVLPGTIRPKALERIQWHRARGDRVVVVSAALCIYLREWCRQLQLEVICTELETKDGMITGRYQMKELARRAESMAKHVSSDPLHGSGLLQVYLGKCVRSIRLLSLTLVAVTMTFPAQRQSEAIVLTS